MKHTQKGFIGIGAVIAIVAGLLAIGGTAYVVTKHKAETWGDPHENTKVQTNTDEMADSNTVPKDWNTYENSSLGFSFSYPNKYASSFNVAVVQGEKGSTLNGSFSNGNAKIYFGGLSDDYTAGHDADIFALTKTSAYAQILARYKTEPIVTASGNTGTVFYGNPKEDDMIGGFGTGGVGAVFTLQSTPFSHLMFVTNEQDVSRDDFLKIIQTVVISEGRDGQTAQTIVVRPSTITADLNDPNLLTYTSYKLGVQFSYLADGGAGSHFVIKPREVGNKIQLIPYIDGKEAAYASNENYVQLFDRASGESVDQVIRKNFPEQFANPHCAVLTLSPRYYVVSDDRMPASYYNKTYDYSPIQNENPCEGRLGTPFTVDENFPNTILHVQHTTQAVSFWADSAHKKLWEETVHLIAK